MIVLFTDFGLSGPYIGQIKAVLQQFAPQQPIIDLFTDIPAYDITSAAHLLAAYRYGFPDGSVFLCVVDPGVGTDQREPVIVKADGHWFVGPDNGLFDVLAMHCNEFAAWGIAWAPADMSASFHARDLFAPVTAMISAGESPLGNPVNIPANGHRVGDGARIIYIDHFGSLVTGVRADSQAAESSLQLAATSIPRVTTFGDVPVGTPLCYENSVGLLEIAVNQGRADAMFGANVGDMVEPTP